MNRYAIEDFGAFVYRVPKLSLEEMKLITKDNIIEKVIASKDILEAIYISSPALYKEIIRYLKGNYNSNKVLKLRLSVLKYLLRMTYRCTPFGLVAGCGYGLLDSKDEILINDYTRKSRLDMDVSYRLVREISKGKAIRDKLLYTLNTSVYFWGNECRYIEQIILKGKRKNDT